MLKKIVAFKCGHNRNIYGEKKLSVSLFEQWTSPNNFQYAHVFASLLSLHTGPFVLSESGSFSSGGPGRDTMKHSFIQAHTLSDLDCKVKNSDILGAVSPDAFNGTTVFTKQTARG